MIIQKTGYPEKTTYNIVTKLNVPYVPSTSKGNSVEIMSSKPQNDVCCRDNVVDGAGDLVKTLIEYYYGWPILRIAHKIYVKSVI